jgi:hypothetical protein
MRCAHFPIRLCADLDRVRDGAVAPVAAAPTKNIENNPMHSSRAPPQPTVRTENLTRRANQRHNFIIPTSAKRPRAPKGAREAKARRLREGAETAKIQAGSKFIRESHTDAVR